MWYQKVPDGLALRRIQATDGTLDLTEPLLFLKYPVVENVRWTSETTGFFSGMAVSVKMQVKTYGKSLITPAAGTFLAYKISSMLELASSSRKTAMSGTDWFSPCIGDVRSNASGSGVTIK